MRALKFILAALVGVALLLAIAAGVHYRLFERGWFHLNQWHQGELGRDASLWLPDYQVTIQGKVVSGVDDDLSALTFDPDRNSLIAVTNGKPHWLELSLEGELLRAIPLLGFGDPEAIEYISEGVYVISDERRQRLLRVEVNEQTTVIDSAQAQQLSLGIDLNGNKGFEGLAYDTAGKRLFVAKERDPVRIYEISGFPFAEPTPSVHINEHDARLFVRDLSSLQFDEQTGHLLALSDESRLVVELDNKGQPLSSLSLSAGRHGLHSNVPQAEGMAMGPDGTLYLVSEPNLFYVFRKQAR
ncbi:SdiA-regulated domain-containing protein [Pseudomonas stutzeri]|uniref:DNA-binding protein n=1 Tax=Stutzerimonas stutzeri TaxID=316 RepID=A0A2N8RYE5_STUST|nr:SdiA-regulated domain-containing protein [Stutzerimonas stutzeri]MCQ4296006.1 SdiA-regulated domain-containing protein [Stutzerimonas stutzeri]PNF79394.1 DNA-binding protein [Stutzerimonas stutzeri]